MESVAETHRELLESRDLIDYEMDGLVIKLDELAARLKAGTVRISPLVYLAGLIKRANAGTFVPEAGLHVADVREKRRRNEAYLKRLQALNDTPAMEQTALEDSPLARRVAAIQLRNRRNSKNT